VSSSWVQEQRCHHTGSVTRNRIVKRAFMYNFIISCSPLQNCCMIMMRTQRGSVFKVVDWYAVDLAWVRWSCEWRRLRDLLQSFVYLLWSFNVDMCTVYCVQCFINWHTVLVLLKDGLDFQMEKLLGFSRTGFLQVDILPVGSQLSTVSKQWMEALMHIIVGYCKLQNKNTMVHRQT